MEVSKIDDENGHGINTTVGNLVHRFCIILNQATKLDTLHLHGPCHP